MRADKYFADKFGSRTKSAEAIEKGLVLVNGKPIRSKDEIKATDEITFIQPTEYFVSNGGYKLAKALQSFHIDCKDKIFVDIGASTGGFTDCLLQANAKRVYAVDVGESLLHESLADNPKIVQMDNTNARHLTKNDFEDRIDGVVTDVSFISLRLIFPVIEEILDEKGFGVVLIKPQFECENKHIGKSGIVAPSAHVSIVKKVLGYLGESKLYPFGITNAPVRKGKNIEYVLYIKKEKTNCLTEKTVLEQVKILVNRNANGELQ